MPMQSQKIKGHFAAALSAISFGLIPLFVMPAKQAGIGMDTLLLYRFFMGGVMIALFMWSRGQSLKIGKNDIKKLAIMGIFYALSSEFMFLGYDLMSVGVASTLIYTYPMIVALILSIGFGERITGLTKLSILLATLGVFSMSWEEHSMEFNFVGIAVVLLGSLSYALYIVMVNKGKLEVRGTSLTCYSLLFSALFYLFKAPISGDGLLLPSSHWVAFIGGFSLVTTVFSVLMMVIAIPLIGSTPTAVLGALEPVVAVGIAVIIWGEKLTWQLVTGIIFIIAALLVSVLETRQANNQ